MYNILKPELISIEGRCYRTNDSHVEVTTFQEHDLYEDEVPLQDEVDDDGDDQNEIHMIDDNRYYTSLHVSKHYLGAIIGKKGAVKMRIERDTKTDIKIPRLGENKDVTIYGPSAPNVKAAKRKINMIVMSSRMRQRATHFISIPVNQPNIMDSFEKFKQEVLQNCTGLEESLFIRSCKLHVTVGVMCLMDSVELTLASKLLMEAKDKIIMPHIRDHLPLRIRVAGVSYMNDDPRETYVVYARVREEDAPPDTLQRMVDALADHFYKAGFMKEKHLGQDKVKMHVTLMNSSYRARSLEDEDTFRSQKWEPFDASNILAKYSDYDFGVTELSEIHISQLSHLSSDIAQPGYYQSTCVITCNK